MFFPPRRDAARAVRQSSRDKSEVRGGEYGVSGNVASAHGPLWAGCLATPRAPSPEKHTLTHVCICTCSAPRQPLLGIARGLCPVLLTGGCFLLCHSVFEPSALYFPPPLECSPFPAPAGTATPCATASSLLCHLPWSTSSSGSALPHNPSSPWDMAGFFHDPVPVVQEPSTCPNTASHLCTAMRNPMVLQLQEHTPPDGAPPAFPNTSATHFPNPPFHVPPMHTHKHTKILPLAKSQLFAAPFSHAALPYHPAHRRLG